MRSQILKYKSLYDDIDISQPDKQELDKMLAMLQETTDKNEKFEKRNPLYLSSSKTPIDSRHYFFLDEISILVYNLKVQYAKNGEQIKNMKNYEKTHVNRKVTKNFISPVSYLSHIQDDNFKSGKL